MVVVKQAAPRSGPQNLSFWTQLEQQHPNVPNTVHGQAAPTAAASGAHWPIAWLRNVADGRNLRQPQASRDQPPQNAQATERVLPPEAAQGQGAEHLAALASDGAPGQMIAEGGARPEGMQVEAQGLAPKAPPPESIRSARFFSWLQQPAAGESQAGVRPNMLQQRPVSPTTPPKHRSAAPPAASPAAVAWSGHLAAAGLNPSPRNEMPVQQRPDAAAAGPHEAEPRIVLLGQRAAEEAARDRGLLSFPYGTVPQWHGQPEFNSWGPRGTLVAPGYRGEHEYWVKKGWAKYPPWGGFPGMIPPHPLQQPTPPKHPPPQRQPAPPKHPPTQVPGALLPKYARPPPPPPCGSVASAIDQGTDTWAQHVAQWKRERGQQNPPQQQSPQQQPAHVPPPPPPVPQQHPQQHPQQEPLDTPPQQQSSVWKPPLPKGPPPPRTEHLAAPHAQEPKDDKTKDQWASWNARHLHRMRADATETQATGGGTAGSLVYRDPVAVGSRFSNHVMMILGRPVVVPWEIRVVTFHYGALFLSLSEVHSIVHLM